MEPDGAGAGPIMTGAVMPSMPTMTRVAVDLGFMVRILRATLEYMRGNALVVPGSVLAPAICYASVEPALRATGMRFESGIQFGFPRPGDFQALDLDEKLFWRLPRSTAGVNSLGFLGREPMIPKPAGTRRVLFLGDSVAQQGYPGMAELQLNLRRPRRSRFDCVTLAVAGYSSHQGRVLADLHGRRLDPDLVVVCFRCS